MSKTKQLEDRVRELEQKLKYKQNKKWYLFPLFLLTLIITVFWVYISVKYFGLFEILNLEPDQVTFMKLEVIPNILFNYILISVVFITLIGWIKNGFGNLKSYDEKGLIWGLIGGLFTGLIGGLIIGLTFGLIGGLIIGLTFGLIGGLIIGLTFGLIGGLIGEFEEKTK